MEKLRFNIEWHDRLGSTNTFMRERFQAGGRIASGWVVAAREQTEGRGRQDRRWQSAPDTNLYVSLFLETGAPLIQVPSLTMAVALAITDLLAARGIGAAPKWPNDVLVDERKICGILSERVEDGAKRGIIIGIGLNVNMSTEEAALIDRPATSMLIESGQACSVPKVLEELLPQLEYWIGQWETGGFPSIRAHWTDKAGPIGKRLSVHDGEVRKSGILSGFGEHGELLLETDDGIETIWSGDVS
jgi:BirA family biotin operon repressor/biotin-[acetyl-CoA-carboxylase] ligase